MITKIVKKEDLSIVGSYPDIADQSLYGGPWGNSSTHGHVEVPDGLDVDGVIAQDVAEKWTKEGETDVSVDPLDPTWTHVPAYIELVENQTLIDSNTQKGRDAKLAELRKQRDVRALKADQEICKHMDGDLNKVATEAGWRTNRVEHRDITDNYRNSSDSSVADFKVGVAALDAFAADLSDFVWPADPV